jgi:hypothetical protein
MTLTVPQLANKMKAMETAFDKKVEALKKDMEAKCNEQLKQLNRAFDAKVEVMMTMLQAKDAEIGKLNKEIGTLQTTSSFLTQETHDLTAKINTNAATIRQATNEVKFVEQKANDLEDRGRRSNLVFFGIEEQQNEDCKAKINDLLRYYHIINDSESLRLDRAHRLGPYKQHAQRPRPIIVKFTYFDAKEFVISRASCLKGSNITVSGDYSKATLAIHRQLANHAKIAKQSGHITRYDIKYKHVVIQVENGERDKNQYRTYDLNFINANSTNWYSLDMKRSKQKTSNHVQHNNTSSSDQQSNKDTQIE